MAVPLRGSSAGVARRHDRADARDPDDACGRRRPLRARAPAHRGPVPRRLDRPPRELAPHIEGWLRFGFDRDPRPASFDEIQRASPSDLATITELIAGSSIYIAVRGDLSSIDRAQLDKHGTVEVVDRASLFVP